MPLSNKIIGIAWPGDMPGFAVVLELIGRKIYLRKEIENEFLPDLIADCMREIQKPPRDIRGIVGRNEPAAMQFIGDWNREEVNPLCNFGVAPMVRTDANIYYHIQLIYRALDPEKKFLFMLPNEPDGKRICKLVSYKDLLPTAGIQDIKDYQHPAMAALGYGLAFLCDEMGSEDDEVRNARSGEDHRDEMTGY